MEKAGIEDRVYVPALDTKIKLSVLTYNVNFGIDPAAVKCYLLRKYAVDIVALQETTVYWQNYISDQYDDIYPYKLWKNDNSWFAGGMGMLSKYPIQEVDWIPAPSNWFNGWVVHISHPILGLVQVLNLHLRPPLEGNSFFPSPFVFYKSQTDRLNDLKFFCTKLIPDVPTIVCGDFNESFDGMYGGYCCKWLETMSMNSATKEHDPNTNTWHWPVWITSLNAKFDHIFYNKNFSCSYSKVIVEGYSDHYPVIAALNCLHTEPALFISEKIESESEVSNMQIS